MRSTDLFRRQHREVLELFERSKVSKAEEKVRCLGHIAEALTIHASLEERHLYPMLREQGLDADADRALDEHTEVKHLVSEMLGRSQRDPGMGALLQKLEALVRDHFSMEEQAIFSVLEQRVEQGRLEADVPVLEREVSELRRQELLKLADEQEAAPT